MKSQISSVETNILSNGHNSPEIQTDSNIKEKNSSPGRFKSFCRIRPFDGINKTFFKFTENSSEGLNQYLNINRSSIKDKSLESLGSKFKFDYIFDEEFTQIEVFQETSMNLITSLVNDRKSSIIIANGLTDSGKTYSIVGDIENPGLLPLSLRFTYDQVMEKKNKMIKLYCNYIEIDGEDNVYDLLSLHENEKTKVKFHNNSQLATFIGKIFIF